MANEGNPQGVFATLKAIEGDPERWRGVLSDNALKCVGLLRERLADVWSAEQRLDAERIEVRPWMQKRLRSFGPS